MKDDDKTKEELIDELVELRQEIARLETSENERKQVEEEKVSARTYLMSSLASIPDAVVLLDKQGKFAYVNPAFKELLGREAKDFIGKTVQEISPPIMSPETTKTVAEKVKKRLETGEPIIGVELEVIDRDNKMTPISYSAAGIRDKKGNVMGGVAIIRDITKRKQAEEELRESEAKMRILLENSPDFITFVDRDATIHFINRPISALTMEEALGKRLYDFTQPYYHDKYRKTLAQVFQTGQANSLVTRRAGPDGHTNWFENRIVPIKHDRQVVAAMLTSTNITELKQAEEELEKYRKYLEEQVEESTKQIEEINAELEAFEFSVSHDLRVPLYAMQNLAQALQENYANKLDDNGKEYAERIVNTSTHMDTMIQDLVEYSRLSRAEIKLNPVSLEKVVEKGMDQIKEEIKENNANVSIAMPLPDVIGQYSMLIQVASNLLTNAIKFIGPGVKPKVKIWAEKHNGWIRLYVEDNGIGIALDDQEKIFQLFETLHGIEKYSGTGVGLAIVKKGMEKMGGKAGVESEVDKGSKFWIELKKAWAKEDS